MTLDIQFKLKSNPMYVRYLHENSYWYKILNRNPNAWKEFVEKVKEDYHLRPMDKINDALDTFEMLSQVLSTLK